MPNLIVQKVLLEYEVPLIVLAKNKQGQLFIGINYDDGETAHLYYFSRIKTDALRLLYSEKIDMHYAVTRLHSGKYELGELWGAPGEEVITKRVEVIAPEILPKPGLFIPGHEIPSARSKTKVVNIDGRWEVSDLRKFSDLVQDCYSFGYALHGATEAASRRTIERIFHKYPWRGGFSAVNFFKSLYKGIPQEDRASIKSISYASPGDIKFIMNDEVAEAVRDLVLDINEEHSDASAAYKEIYRTLQDRGWLGKSETDLALDDFDEAELRALLARGCAAFAIGDHSTNILNLASNDHLAAVKIVLAYYRRLKSLADYVATGKAQDLFHDSIA